LTPTLRLRWSWRLDKLPSRLPEDTALTHDYISVALEFDDGRDLTWHWSAGLPPGFALESTTSLGLSIVRDLVTTQLGGSIAMYGGKGTHVELRIPAGPGAGDGLG